MEIVPSALDRQNCFQTAWDPGDAGNRKEYNTAIRWINFIRRTFHFTPSETEPFSSRSETLKYGVFVTQQHS